MRNLRKLTAVVIAIALVLTSMTAAFAADSTSFETQATVLKNLGIWTGDSQGNLMLDKELTRVEGAILVLKTILLKTEADKDAADLTVLDKFEDAASIPGWAKGWMALAIKEGVLSGGSDNKLNPNGKLLGKDFASMYNNALKLPNEYGKAVEMLAAAAKVDALAAIASSLETKELTRGDASGVVFYTFGVKAKDATKTIIENFVGTDTAKLAIAQTAGLIAVAPAEVAVDSIKALNAKQIEVKFNKAMDKDSVETESFYEVKDKGTTVINLGADSAKLQDDKMTVIISLDAALTDKLTNSSNAKVKVKKDIKAADGKKLAADKEVEFAVQDGLIPSVTKVEATGDSTIKLTLSEPIYFGGAAIPITDAGNFTVKSGTYTYYVQTAAVSSNVVTLTLGTKMVDGPVVVTVNKDGATSGALQDYAGYKVFKGESTFTYAKDTSVATVTVSEAKQTSIKLKFSKPVKASNIKLFHSVKDTAAYLSQVSSTGGVYVDEITFPFSANKLPAGTVKLFLVNSTASGEELVDGYGVKVPDQTLTATITVDETGPVVSATEVDTNLAFKITFDEEVSTTVATVSTSYTFKSVSDNKDVYFSTPVLDSTKKIVTLNVPGHLSDNTQYQVVVKKAEDLLGNKIAAEATFTFTTGDNTAPTVKTADSFYVAGDGFIYIYFSEPMNETQMLDKTNYIVATSGVVYATLGSDDKVTKVSDKCVKLDLVSTLASPSVKVAPIMDLAGKRLGNSVDSVVFSPVTESVNIANADLIAKNKIKLTFNKELSSFDNTDIGIATTAGVTTIIRIQTIESMTKNTDGKTEVVCVLDRDIGTNGVYDGQTTLQAMTVTTPNSVAISGTKLGGTASVNVADKLAPSINMTKTVGGYSSSTDEVANVSISTAAINLSNGNITTKGAVATVTAIFSEALKKESISTLTFKVDGFVVDAVDVTGATVTLSVHADADNTVFRSSLTQVYNITDTAGNTLASGTVWTVR